MGEQERRRGQGDVARPERADDDEEAELGHGAEGEDELEVELPQRLPAAHEHRRDPEREEHGGPAGHAVEPGREAQDEVDPGLDHRRGVQVGAHRGGGGHRAGQPEVERDQGGLRHRADEDEHHRGDDEAAVDPHGVADVDDHRDPAGAHDHGEEDDADEHREPAGGGDDEGLESRTAGLLAAVVLPDEEVGEHRGALPENEEEKHLVGEDEAVHHAGERHEDAGEAGEPGLVGGEVARAVDEDERTDPGDEQAEQPGQGVHEEDDLEVERREPVEALHPVVAAGQDPGQLGEGDDEAGARDEREDEEGGASAQAEQRCGEERGHEERPHQHCHAPALSENRRTSGHFFTDRPSSRSRSGR